MFSIYNVIFSSEKVLNGQNHSLPPDEKIPCPYQNFPSTFSHWEGEFLTYPFNAICKTLARFTFPSQGVEIISTYFSL